MTRCRPLLGTFVEISANEDGAIAAGFAAVERVHRLMSAHDPDSDVSRLNTLQPTRNQALPIDPATMRVIRRAAYWAEQSGGCFDIVTAGRNSIKRGAIPRHKGQHKLDATADHHAVQSEGDYAWFDRPAAIDLGGIAKGYAVDEAAAAMRCAGASWGIINAGGDLAAFGRPQPVTVVDPASRAARVELLLDERALATSAALPNEAGLDIRHLPPRGADIISVTVEAARAVDADALTKIAWAGHPRLAELLALADARAFALTGNGIVVDLGVLELTQ